MKKVCSLLLAAALCLGVCACNRPTPQGQVPYEVDVAGKTAESIRAEARDVIRGDDAAFRIDGVTQAETSQTVTQEKFELDIDATVTGNVYDPDAVDVYGEFVSPSNRVYTMPAFWYRDYTRTFEALDESAEYGFGGSYFVQGSGRLVGVLDRVNGVKRPVGKAEFTDATETNIGAILNTGSVSALHDAVSVWLRKDERFTAEKFYLGFYGSEGEAYIEIQDLTAEWKQYTFLWQDFTFAQADGGSAPVALSKMYSGRVQTRNATADGAVYIADMRALRHAYPNQYAVLADFVAPDLATYRDGELNGNEVMTPTAAEPNFKLRFRFTEPGEWVYRITAKKDRVVKSTVTQAVTVTENPDEEKNRGSIVVEPTQKRNFMFQDGTPYVAHGHNLAYSVDPRRGSFDYEVYMPQMQAAGMNFIRVWLTYIGHGVQSTEGGVLNFDYRQDKAYQMDRIVEMAAEYGLYMQIPLMTFSRFHVEGADDDVEHRSWDSSPYNVVNGGYLQSPAEFWTDARAKEDTKKLYRYYIARYGYSRNILNWEIMNEIGEASPYNGSDAKAWANEIADYMHAADPYRHLVSLSSKTFIEEVYEAASLDFISIHSYVWGNEYASSAAAVTTLVHDTYGKPVMIGEIGASSMSAELNFATDPKGLVMRQTAWTAPMSGSAGGGMMWWWVTVNAEKYFGNLTPAIEYFKLLPATFMTMQNLADGDFTVTADKEATNIRSVGFKSDTAVYAYLYDVRYNYGLRNPSTFTGAGVTYTGMQDGAYTVRIFDAQNGGVLSTVDATSTDGKLSVDLGSWSLDVALLIEKK